MERIWSGTPLIEAALTPFSSSTALLQPAQRNRTGPRTRSVQAATPLLMKTRRRILRTHPSLSSSASELAATLERDRKTTPHPAAVPPGSASSPRPSTPQTRQSVPKTATAPAERGQKNPR